VNQTTKQLITAGLIITAATLLVGPAVTGNVTGNGASMTATTLLGILILTIPAAIYVTGSQPADDPLLTHYLDAGHHLADQMEYDEALRLYRKAHAASTEQRTRPVHDEKLRELYHKIKLMQHILSTQHYVDQRDVENLRTALNDFKHSYQELTKQTPLTEAASKHYNEVRDAYYTLLTEQY
jgi:hypothetical protein